MRIFKAIMEGLIWSLIGIGVLWLTLPADYLEVNPQLGTFVRRWDGTCDGWNKSLALRHVIGDLATWSAYVVIAIVMLRLHPILKRIPSAKITVPLIVLVFSTCGATHLFEAYATFNPIYELTGWFKIFAACIGLAGSVYVAHNLVVAFDVAHKDKARLEELEREELERRLSQGR